MKNYKEYMFICFVLGFVVAVGCSEAYLPIRAAILFGFAFGLILFVFPLGIELALRWNTVPPRLREFTCDHEWICRQQGGDPTDVHSGEWIAYCKHCGQEKPGSHA